MNEKPDLMLNGILNRIKAADAEAMAEAGRYLDKLAKPPGSLGKLEEIACRYAGITGKLHNDPGKKRIIVLCADNGVTAEGVSSAPVSVTAAQAVNMTGYLTGMSSMARAFGQEIQVVDVGIATEYKCDKIINRNIRKGTGNILYEKAMTEQEVYDAILTGISLADRASADDVRLIGVGEMGIGNTTTSSAVLAALTGKSAEEVTGRGGGLTDKAFELKKSVIDRALRFHKLEDGSGNVTEILSCVGGLDIASMCGVFIGAALNRIPAVIDGFISIVAALCAVRICPAVRDYLFPSHLSEEKGYLIAAKALDLDPWLSLDMRLGEGSGCVIAFCIIEAACAMMNGMGSFETNGIDDGYLEEIRKSVN
ncbi:MAG: nicotinate-nucleotide--dimethylbenzimidazole phosphoribosyltransferase [Lachnospiraceae bacterium]|nr:nicotinate-nucleotide--dimethylbenzimidazole phosphoribosyltransferase [Lachnospiraceae bacterium]